jgi:hypothetical protein
MAGRAIRFNTRKKKMNCHCGIYIETQGIAYLNGGWFPLLSLARNIDLK